MQLVNHSRGDHFNANAHVDLFGDLEERTLKFALYSSSRWLFNNPTFKGAIIKSPVRCPRPQVKLS